MKNEYANPEYATRVQELKKELQKLRDQYDWKGKCHETNWISFSFDGSCGRVCNGRKATKYHIDHAR
jgi:hypothetical protein